MRSAPQSASPGRTPTPESGFPDPSADRGSGELGRYAAEASDPYRQVHRSVMLNIFARASVARVTDPVGAWLVRAGLTPNAMTIVGTVGTVVSALVFFPLGQLFLGSALVTVFVLFDLLDGAMARTAGRVTRFGTVLDASCDRIADGVLFGAITWWALVVAGDRLTGAAALVCLVCAQVISYIKARADAEGLDADGGLVERAERFIIALLGTAIQGLGVPYAARVALLLLAVLALITVGQRLVLVWRSAHQDGASENREATT